MTSVDNLNEVIKRFVVEGEYISSEPYGSGHINDTYLTIMNHNGDEVKYITQRINHEIFKNPEALMENIVRVTEHVRNKVKLRNGDLAKECLEIIPTLENKSFYKDNKGFFWRMYVFILGASTHDVLSHDDQAYQAAFAFGQFQKDLVDIKGERLFETIPDFHHTVKRFETLLKAIEDDKYDRKKDIAADIEFALQRKEFCGQIIKGMEDGLIPERITHNDTKINNVMLDDDTGECRAVIDLDTVMPGSALYDFGDLIRTTVSTAEEDEKDTTKITANLIRYENLVKGFLKGAGNCLVEKEIELLPVSGRIITFECGIRFLTDYLDGDKYFKIHHVGHNLDRARSQFKLVKSMEEKADEMVVITKKYL
ncbi:MAG: mucin desulfatase [Planctomycetota bacterium]|nr:MAG: mucin desulfatase [Planctomycetota bacterium]